MEAPVPANLEELVKLLNETLGSKGLDDLTEREIDYVKQLMSNYTSQANDWKKYSHFDPMKYTRNLVDDGNGKFNLMVLCWNIGQVRYIIFYFFLFIHVLVYYLILYFIIIYYFIIFSLLFISNPLLDIVINFLFFLKKK